ncbi:MAG: hypothetical protein JWP74_11 [Marmoricola sp.]|nr:hypothetical protein [Marmoricola sp.]
MPTPLGASRAVLTVLRRSLLIHRRGLAAVCAGITVWLLAQAALGPPQETVQAWTAAHDLTSGTVLAAGDLRRTAFLPTSVPPGASRSRAIGRTLAVPVQQGSVLTGADLLGASVLAGYPGRSAVAVRISDPDAVALLHSGDRIGLLASDPQGGAPAAEITSDATVLAVPPSSASGTGAGDQVGRLVVLAVPSTDAAAVASAAVARYLTVIWNR